jgi:hypothetical protein
MPVSELFEWQAWFEHRHDLEKKAMEAQRRKGKKR